MIGTSFDHTHPDFIKEFMKDENVRFFRQDSGTFHPKFYLFQNNKSKWEILVGSMNFTKGGFSENSEVLALITQDDDDTNEIYNNARRLIDDSWGKAKYFSEQELDDYEIAWKNQQRRSGKYGKGKSGKPIHRVEIMNLSWQKFVERVKTEDKYHSLDNRLDLLDSVNELFRKYPHFSSMNENERKGIAGFLEEQKERFDWRWFGSMSWGKFQNKINNNNENISLALDKIPIKGKITTEHYESFLNEYKKATPEAKNDWIGTTSRLLAMKRPDVFVCFNSKNRKKLCTDFGIKPSDMTYERYWDEIIERIQDSDWWNSPKPEDKIEIKIWNGRSAFLDAIYYEE